MTRPQYSDGITRDMDLEERVSGYRGVQHNPFDPECRVRYHRDNYPANKCPICRPVDNPKERP